MYSIYGLRPTTPEERTVLGCLWQVFLVVLIGLSLYACIRTGFRDPRGTTPLAVGVVLAALSLAARYVIRRYIR